MSVRDLALLALAVLLQGAAWAAPLSVTIPFTTPVVTGSSQAPGVWYTDRYAPSQFVSPVMHMGGERLLQQISAADCQSCRPASYSSAFYNTQGRKYDLPDGIVILDIELFVDSSWATAGRRMAGLWGTAFDAADAVSFYPILEFTSTEATPRFRAWNNGVWIDLGLPTGFAYDQFQLMAITLSGGMFHYQVGDLTTSVSALTSERIGNVILQGHNNDPGVTYSIYWDNLHYSNGEIPEVGTFLAAAAGLGVIAMLRRRRG